MSFILDALRKSENSRLRQDHPAVFSNRIVATRQRLPVWSIVLITLLVVNLLIIALLLLRELSVDSAVVLNPTESSSPSVTTTAPSEMISVVPPDATTESVVTPATPPVASTESVGLILRDDLIARGTSLPPTDLNMHVFDANPQQRFVLLNGQRLREGESSREGLLVERITSEGVVLRFGSNTFAVNLQ